MHFPHFPVILEGRPQLFRAPQYALWRALGEAGTIQTGEGHHTIGISIHQGQQRLFKLSRQAVEEMWGLSWRKAVTRLPHETPLGIKAILKG
jgi:hypothetical protein